MIIFGIIFRKCNDLILNVIMRFLNILYFCKGFLINPFGITHKLTD